MTEEQNREGSARLRRPTRHIPVSFRRLRAKPWASALALGLLLLLYLSTLQQIVNGSDHEYMIDVGEIQVALNTWGTIHYTGYPHYTVLSSIVTQAARACCLSPAAAASFPSLLWSLLGLAVIYRIFLRIGGGDPLPAAAGVLLLGATESVWLHSVIAEVYSFSLLAAALSLWLALRLHERWRRRDWFLLLLAAGTAVAHHRIHVLLLPGLLLLAVHPWWTTMARSWWESPRRRWPGLLRSALLFLLPFLAYLYLPWRDWQGALWVYGDPGTWDGFWRVFSGSEVAGNLLRLPRGGEWHSNAAFLLNHLRRQLPLPGVVAGLLGLFWLARHRPALGAAFLSIVLLVPAFIYLFPPAVWAPAVLLPALALLVAGIVYLARRLGAVRPPLALLLALAMLVAVVFLYRANRPFVRRLVEDPFGREVIQTLTPLDEVPLPGGRPVVAIPWGTGYFAAAYGRYVTGTLQEITLVDHRADFAQIVETEGQLLTPAYTLNYWPPGEWRQRLGPVRFGAAAPGVTMIGRGLRYQNPPLDINFDTGVGVRIRSAKVLRDVDALRITLFWEATGTIVHDYSVAVHLLAQDPPQGPGDVLAQADAVHPVGGWYPTTQWAAGEIVRDAYAITIPPETQPAAVRLGLYRQDESGQFINSRWLSLSLDGDL